MLDDILELIVDIIFEIATVSDNKRTFARLAGGVLLGVLICICVLLIFGGINTNSALLIISGSALLIVILFALLAIVKYKKKK
ncbi:MAG: hypothetical protein IJ326_05920 [Lachnospiraceae bacterium]|nr:hypothetical protein [Lachnospiraceae bacterium]